MRCTINTVGLRRADTGLVGSLLLPSLEYVPTGSTSNEPIDYQAEVSGPSNFDGSDETFASCGSGHLTGILFGDAVVPAGYVSGNALADTSTYNGNTFGSFSVTPGTSAYSVGSGSGANADTLTVQIGTPACVPRLASIALFGTNLVEFGLVRQCRRAGLFPRRAPS